MLTSLFFQTSRQLGHHPCWHVCLEGRAAGAGGQASGLLGFWKRVGRTPHLRAVQGMASRAAVPCRRDVALWSCVV